MFHGLRGFWVGVLFKHSGAIAQLEALKTTMSLPLGSIVVPFKDYLIGS